MRVLLDENIDHNLRHLLATHEVQTAQYAGLSNLFNGALLKAASNDFDVLITLDQHMSYQNRLADYDLIVVMLKAGLGRLKELAPLVPKILAALEDAKPGQFIAISRD